jgi:ribosomal protein S27AE
VDLFESIWTRHKLFVVQRCGIDSFKPPVSRSMTRNAFKDWLVKVMTDSRVLPFPVNDTASEKVSRLRRACSRGCGPKRGIADTIAIARHQQAGVCGYRSPARRSTSSMRSFLMMIYSDGQHAGALCSGCMIPDDNNPLSCLGGEEGRKIEWENGQRVSRLVA